MGCCGVGEVASRMDKCLGGLGWGYGVIAPGWNVGGLMCQALSRLCTPCVLEFTLPCNSQFPEVESTRLCNDKCFKGSCVSCVFGYPREYSAGEL